MVLARNVCLPDECLRRRGWILDLELMSIIASLGAFLRPVSLPQGGVIPFSRLTALMEEYYPTVVINCLLSILSDESLAEHHQFAMAGPGSFSVRLLFPTNCSKLCTNCLGLANIRKPLLYFFCFGCQYFENRVLRCKKWRSSEEFKSSVTIGIWSLLEAKGPRCVFGPPRSQCFAAK